MNAKIPHSDILNALDRTGFPLEHQVTEEFRKQKWGVLSGRYYIDDIDGQARELDLVAYRIYNDGDVDVVSTVLVSCKKEGENTWAFLSRPLPKADKNLDWCPVHIWTDEEPLSTFLQTPKWKNSFEKKAHEEQPEFYKVMRDIFAYQVIAPPRPQQVAKNPKAMSPPGKAAAPRNDTPIFSSIIGLLKALHYEKSALPKRVAKRNRVYVFHLLVVADAPLVDVQYDSKIPNVQDVTNILHLARYIVAGQQMTALVQIVSASDLQRVIKKIDAIGKFDAESIGALLPMSYSAIKDTPLIQEYFAKRIKHSVLYYINKELREEGFSEDASELSITTGSSGSIQLNVDISPEAIDAINQSNSRSTTETSKLLQKFARYVGNFEFTSDFPF